MLSTDNELKKIAEEQDDYKRMLLFLMYLVGVGSDFIVVGGSALEIYSFGKYVSGDIDVISTDRYGLIGKLEDIGFVRKPGAKIWISEELRLFFEIPSNVLQGDYEKAAGIDVGQGIIIKVIGVEDLILDRLNSCVHWKYETDCEWAEYLLSKYKDRIDMGYLQTQAQKQEVLDKLQEITQKDDGEYLYIKPR